MQLLINHTLIHYLIINPQGKKSLVILHGWGQSSADWISLAQLINPHYRLILLDLPGFGSSQHLPPQAGTPEYSQLVHQFTATLKLKKFVLLGHSFGGQIAVDFALHYPQLLSHLFLVSPAAVRQPSLKTKIIKSIKSFFPFKPSFISHLFQSPDYQKSSAAQKQVLSLILTQDYSSQLHHLTTPTTIIWGSEDTSIPYMGKFLAEHIPHSTLTVLYDTDHHPHIKQTSLLANTINHYL